MKDTHASAAFEDEGRKLVAYFRREFNLTYCEAIGVLDILKGELIAEALEEGEEEGLT